MRRILRLLVLLIVTPIRMIAAFFVTLSRDIIQAFKDARFDAMWELREAVRDWRSSSD